MHIYFKHSPINTATRQRLIVGKCLSADTNQLHFDPVEWFWFGFQVSPNALRNTKGAEMGMCKSRLKELLQRLLSSFRPFQGKSTLHSYCSTWSHFSSLNNTNAFHFLKVISHHTTSSRVGKVSLSTLHCLLTMSISEISITQLTLSLQNLQG